MIPWLIVALVVVPLLVVAFVAARRRTVAGDPAREGGQAGALMEQEFGEAEAYQAKWRQEDRARYDQERLP